MPLLRLTRLTREHGMTKAGVLALWDALRKLLDVTIERLSSIRDIPTPGLIRHWPFKPCDVMRKHCVVTTTLSNLIRGLPGHGITKVFVSMDSVVSANPSVAMMRPLSWTLGTLMLGTIRD